MKNPLQKLLAGAMMALVSSAAHADEFKIDGNAGTKLNANSIAEFDEPWAMTFLPDGKMLVTEKAGRLFLVTSQGSKTQIANLPKVEYAGQGGMGDIILHPQYADNALIYFSYVEREGNQRGAVVDRAKLVMNGTSAQLVDIQSIWKQSPKTPGKGHYSHRMAFAPDGKLMITSGDRQLFDPAQDFNSSLGKIIRINDDGSIPADNPWQDKGELAKSFWSMGHRNLLGMSYDAEGNLWQHEMGPRHGDELNLVEKGKNYGWPEVSEGRHYSGIAIPAHSTRPEFTPPIIAWVPSIAPSGLAIYQGSLFPDWKGDIFIGGLVSEALIHVDINGTKATEAERFSWGKRIREVEEGPDGAIYVLEDGSDGKLLKLTPNG